MEKDPKVMAHELLVALAQGGQLELKNTYASNNDAQTTVAEAHGAYFSSLHRQLVMMYSRE